MYAQRDFHFADVSGFMVELSHNWNDSLSREREQELEDLHEQLSMYKKASAKIISEYQFIEGMPKPNELHSSVRGDGAPAVRRRRMN